MPQKKRKAFLEPKGEGLPCEVCGGPKALRLLHSNGQTEHLCRNCLDEEWLDNARFFGKY